jgi:Na+/alanine symporter
MPEVQEQLDAVADVVWGPYLLIPLLLLAGLYLTILLKGLQFHKLGYALWLALIKRREEGAEGDISHYAALMTALAAVSVARLLRVTSDEAALPVPLVEPVLLSRLGQRVP